MMFGPAGALFGAAAGRYFIDRKANASQKKIFQSQLTFYTAALHELAICDGAMQRPEESLILDLMREYNAALGNIFPDGHIGILMEKTIGIPRAGEKFAAMVRKQGPVGEWFALRFFRLASVDGNPGEHEVAYLRAISRDMGLAEFTYTRLYTHFVRSSDPESVTTSAEEACRILEVRQNADLDEIKRAYRSMTLKYHPDRHANLPPEIMELTAEKFRSVQQAYRTLSGDVSGGGFHRCFKLEPPRMAGAECGIIEAEAGGVARCFLCGKDAILPDENNLASARCPFCQARMTLMRHDLDRLTKETPTYPQPRQ